ncbi:hypothetical protein ACFWDN_13040 [Micromonospora chalcea]
MYQPKRGDRATIQGDELDLKHGLADGTEVTLVERDLNYYGRVWVVETGDGRRVDVAEFNLRFQPRLIIGMVGRQRAGKDTFAARLVETHGYVRYSFADNVRKAALAIDPIIDVPTAGYPRLSEAVETLGWEHAKSLSDVRRLLQRLGTDAIRAMDEDFWVRQLIGQVEAETRPVVVTDVRFPNEAAAIERLGGKLVRVVRPNWDSGDLHVSETAMDDWGTAYEVVNDSTLEHLRALADLVAGLELELRGR